MDINKITTDKGKQVALELAMNNITKVFGEGTLFTELSKPMQDIEVISSQCAAIDFIVLGVGGFPRGRIIEIYGPEASGKCLTDDTNILTPFGYKTIKEIFNENNLETCCDNKEVEKSYALINKDGEVEKTTHFVFNGMQPVNKIKTKCGTVIKGTDKHPLCSLGENGLSVWKHCGEIKKGDILFGRNEHTYELYLAEVEEVEKLQPVPTFDFAMEKTHTFIAEGIINHNTSLSLQTIAEAQQRGGVAAIVDTEHSLSLPYARALGVNTDALIVSQPDTGEQALDIVECLIRSGAVDIVVVDSVAALVPKAMIDGEMGDSHVGLQARLMSQALKKLSGVVRKSNTLLIFTNQLRENIGITFGSKEVQPGGKALKFYASIRLDIRRISQIKKDDVIIGQTCKVKGAKNKVSPPFREVEVDVYYGKGISKEASVLDLGDVYNIVKKSGSWYSYGDMRLGQGKQNAIAFLESSPELYDEIYAKIAQIFRPE